VCTYLLVDLQLLDDRGKLAQDLERLLVVLHLGSDQLGKVPQGLRSIQNLS
jgi:hypothetical protein